MRISYWLFDDLSLSFREDNNYVNATVLSKRYFDKTGKRRQPNDWLRLSRTKETISYVSTVTGIPVTALVQVVQGGNTVDEQGTFLHPDLIIPFASWLSVEFEYKVTKIIQYRIVEDSLSEHITSKKRLEKLLQILKAYFKSVESKGEIIHTQIHRQVGDTRSALQIIDSYLKGDEEL
jgi:hypothetical protein